MAASARPLPLAAVLTAGALVCGYAGFILLGVLHRALPALAPPMLATAPLFYLLFTRRVPPRESLGPRSGPATALVTLVGAPVFAGLAHVALALPIIKAASGRDATFTAAMKDFALALVVGVVVVSAVAAWMRAGERRRVGALLAALAPAVLIVELALVAVTLASSRPTPSGYVDALPVVATAQAWKPAGGDDVTVVGGVALTRRCAPSHTCGVWLRRFGEAPPAAASPDLTTKELLIAVRRDAAHDLWIVDATGGRDNLFIDDVPVRWAAYRGSDLARAELRPRTLTGQLAPPRAWIAVALIGAAIAAKRLSRRRAARAALDEILAAEPGNVDEGGFITLARGGAPLRAPAGTAAGPVLVASPPGAASSAYRVDAARPIERVLVGTRAYLEAEARHALATLDARALATVVITIAPLATAWLEGLR